MSYETFLSNLLDDPNLSDLDRRTVLIELRKMWVKKYPLWVKSVRWGISHQYKKLYSFLIERDGKRCVYCGSTEKKLEIDHIRPVTKGGNNREDNLQLLCVSCNRSKRISFNEEIWA